MGRRLATLLVCASAARIVLTAHAYQPVSQWLLWPVLGYWLAALTFTLASLGMGTRLLRWSGVEGYSRNESLLLGVTLGVYAMSVAIFAVGLFSLSFPVACGLVVGGFVLGGLSTYRALLQALRDALGRARCWAFHPLSLLVVPLAVLVLAAVYIPVLNLHNLQYDARWYHLPIAAQYVAQGRVAPFVEGWILGAYPHLSSYLFTWALLFPLPVVHGIGIAAHLEFILFAITLLAVPLAIARASSDGRVGYAWAACFLFPGYLVYDANVSLGADHIAALWAPVLLIVLFELFRAARLRDAALLGVFAAAAACTKYSALCLVLPVGVAAIFFALWTALPLALKQKLGALVRCLPFVEKNARIAPTDDAAEGGARTLLRGLSLLAVCGTVFLLAWSPHWLKNWLWYGDPLYPLLHEYLHVHPWNPSTDGQFDAFNREMVAHGPRTLPGLVEALWAAVSYGFETREFDFHGQRPVFGFLFAALLPVLPFVRVGRRGWGVLSLVLLGLMSWYMTYTRDRYLQALLPWMVVFAAVTLRACWHGGSRSLRAATALLLAVQVVQGLDLFFLRSHVMARGHHPLTGLFDNVTAGFRGGVDWAAPHDEWHMSSWLQVGHQLPSNATLLSHRERLWTGVGVPVVTDETRWQAGIDYDRASSRGALLKQLQQMGITHVLTGPTEATTEYGPMTVGGELRLWDLLAHARELRPVAPFRLWELPAQVPPADAQAEVAVFTCGGHGMPAGVYSIGQLALGPEAGRPESLLAPALSEVQEGVAKPKPPFVVLLNGCGSAPPGYRKLQQFGMFQLYQAADTASR